MTDSFMTIVLAAVLVEAVVTFISQIKERERSWKYWTSLVVGLLVAILVSVNYELDLFEAIGLTGSLPYVGAILTGIIIARGANYVADLLQVIISFRKA